MSHSDNAIEVKAISAAGRLRLLAGSVPKTVSGRLVEWRRHLARNFPYLWLIRAHLVAIGSICFAVISLFMALVIPVRLSYVPDAVTWHTWIFLFAALFVLYWISSYFRVLSPRLIPPTAREPAIVALIACAFLIVMPTYMFLYVVKHRIVTLFPDVPHEEQVQLFFQTLTADMGDVKSPLRELTLTGQTRNSSYQIEPGGVIGPVTERGKRADQLSREMACDLGRAIAPDIARTYRFTLGQPAPAADGQSLSGALVPNAIERPLVGRFNKDFASLYEGYSTAGALRYHMTGAQASSADYCLQVQFSGLSLPRQCSSGRSFSVDFDCQSLQAEAIPRLSRALRAATANLIAEYLPSNRLESEEGVLNQVFTPACDAGMNVNDCARAYIRLTSIRNLLGNVLSTSDIHLLASARQTYQEPDFAASITLKGPIDTPQQTVAFPLAPKPVPTDDPSAAWLTWWLFLFGLVAIFVKSLRLVGENATNYLFLALFLVPGIYFGSLFIDEAVSAGALLTVFAALVAYVGWQASRRRSSKLGQLSARFLLFFLVAFSFFVPWLSLPWLGPAYELDHFWLFAVLLIYFAVLYEGCYYLARIVIESPH
jgi:hypothetical protein